MWLHSHNLFSSFCMYSQFWRRGAWWKSASGHVTLMLRYVPLYTMIQQSPCGNCEIVLLGLFFCFAICLRLACSQTVILKLDRRLVWFLTAGTPSSYRLFPCKQSVNLLLNLSMSPEVKYGKDIWMWWKRKWKHDLIVYTAFLISVRGFSCAIDTEQFLAIFGNTSTSYSGIHS